MATASMEIYGNDLVPVRIVFAEKSLIERAKLEKGRWNTDARLWFIRYGKIKGKALEKHIVLDANSCTYNYLSR